nr:hypothetical protein KLPFCKAP_00005 [Escherichia coli]
MQLSQIVFTVLEIRIQLGHVLQILFNLQLLRNTVSTQRHGVVRIVFYRLSVAVNRLLNACRVRHFQRIVEALQVGVVDIGQTHAIQLQLLLNDFRFQRDLVTDIFHRLLLNNAGDIVDVTFQNRLRVSRRRGGKAQRP